jgi:hypothetical protein
MQTYETLYAIASGESAEVRRDAWIASEEDMMHSSDEFKAYTENLLIDVE